jgi:hypothetical protein
MKKILFTIASVMVLLFTGCGKTGHKVIQDLDLFPFERDNMYGYANMKGEIVIAPMELVYAGFFRDGLALAVIDVNIKKATLDGSDSVEYPVRRFGYLNAKGQWAIEPRYAEATDFYNGFAWVVEEGGCPQLINTKGKVQTESDADAVSVYIDGIASCNKCVVKDKSIIAEAQFIDIKGNKLFENIEGARYYLKDYSEKLMPFRMDDKYGYVDNTGAIKINPQFGEVYPFFDGVAVVESGDKYGVIDKNGKYVINPQFDAMVPDKGMFMVLMGDQWGWVDKKGTYVINPQFSNAKPFGEANLAPVKMGDSWGYIDKKGTIKINPQFDYAQSFCGKYALVRVDDLWGTIDKKGAYVANPQFDIDSYQLDEYLFGELPLHVEVKSQAPNINVVNDYIDWDGLKGKFPKNYEELAVMQGIERYDRAQRVMFDSTRFNYMLNNQSIGGGYIVALCAMGNNEKEMNYDAALPINTINYVIVGTGSSEAIVDKVKLPKGAKKQKDNGTSTEYKWEKYTVTVGYTPAPYNYVYVSIFDGNAELQYSEENTEDYLQQECDVP